MNALLVGYVQEADENDGGWETVGKKSSKTHHKVFTQVDETFIYH